MLVQKAPDAAARRLHSPSAFRKSERHGGESDPGATRHEQRSVGITAPPLTGFKYSRPTLGTSELRREAARGVARFEREARVLASLNHSNIASLHAFEKDGVTKFLVMELVEGETLAERIARGPLSADEAIPLFLQIAEGLAAAHEGGVVHRDLKPANIKVAQHGAVKILDFGLAKAVAPAVESAAASMSHSPTLTLAATQRGEILGTAAYMSPERARGQDVDLRADVWAFGVCLYEALTGRRTFEGDDAPDTMAAVLRAEIDGSLGAPQPLFSTRNLAPNDISRDGSRFLAVKRPEMEPIREVRLVLNWSASLDECLDDLGSN